MTTSVQKRAFGWLVVGTGWSCNVGVVPLVTLHGVHLVEATGVLTVLVVKSMDDGSCTSNLSGSWGHSKGIEFGIASYFSFEITSAKYPSCPPPRVVGTLCTFFWLNNAMTR